MSEISLVLVDDHSVVRRGLRTFLESFAEIVVVGEADSGEAALENMEAWLPQVVVMDLLLPGGMDGIEATRRVRKLAPNTQVVVLTAHTDEARVIGALRAGAIGYVRKDADPELLLTAVRAASRGQSVLDPAVAGVVLQELAGQVIEQDELTQREMTVLRLLAHGRSNRDIAAELTVSEETIKTHVGNILSKLHMAQRTQAVIAALKQGLISLDEIEL
ncbi:MAG: response regulator transcription factor [Anaerolineales bacterium]|nr:response regulator transcription factor [Anaerolineales bacterium]